MQIYLQYKVSKGDCGFLQAPLFGMLSWVNSSEVRRWLQTKISDTNALRSAAAAATLPGQDALYSVPLQSHGSEGNLQLAQDLGIRTSNATGGSDLQWVSVSLPSCILGERGSRLGKVPCTGVPTEHFMDNVSCRASPLPVERPWTCQLAW